MLLMYLRNVIDNNEIELRIRMQLKRWSELPSYMKNKEVKKYYDIIEKRRCSLLFKRIFDVIASMIMLLIVSPFMVVLMIMIKLDSKGPVFFRQERVTQYGKIFCIFKFRSMVHNAEEFGVQITACGDTRITKVGAMLRKLRIDELPQLFNILIGDMTFVGTRPEVKKYVDCYTNEMYATLLLPAGLTSRTSIEYKDEDKLLEGADDITKVYIEKVLPEKMKYNLKNVKHFSLLSDIMTMFATFFAILK